jgi:hypothetical protein
MTKMKTREEENEDFNCGADQDLQLQTIDLCREAPGYSRIEKLRAIVEAKSFMEIEGVPVDMQSANVVVQVHDALRPENQASLMARSTITSIIDIAWKVAAAAAANGKSRSN